MRKFLKWFFVSPVLFIGLWLIGLCSARFRENLINLVEHCLYEAIEELERRI